ncbi:tetratricopeptide repeat protein [Streptomyces sp. SID12501]|uniref:tetratricopeptide repeat protein n=1 Tax=Streptomyces sp. SID12501 TaxID=2706042 RepID=UPI0031BBB44B
MGGVSGVPAGEPEEPPAFKGTALCVVCEEYDDSRTFPQLVGAKAQMAEIAGRLEELGYEVRVVGGGDPDRGAFDREVREWSKGWRETGARKPALILWSGHGVLVDEQLRLVLRDLVPGDHSAARKSEIRSRGVSVEELVDHAVSSDADQILVLVDACYSGDGAGQSVQTALDHWSEVSLPPGRTKWLGFMAGCQRNERSAGDGPLFRTLAEVLRKGPRTDEYLSAWSTRNELVTGVDILAALPTRWEEDGQRPVRAAAGDESRAFPNPLAVPGAPPTLVEHLVLAARGVGHREEGWFFTGRRRVLGQIVDWMETGEPGLFLVTGPAGCGKSAVLGRIATLADAVQRAEAVGQGALREGDPDPGLRESRSFAAVHLRGLNATQAAAELAERLGLREPRNADAFKDELRELPTPPVIVLDGLDEVPAEHTKGMIEELVFPLSLMVPVLVGSRERSFQSQLANGETLLAALVRHVGTGANAVDLGSEPDTREDITGYVRRRFEAAGVAGATGEEVAEVLAGRATAEGGGFLFARLVAGFLITEIQHRDTGETIDSDDLVARLPDSVEAAFEEDLRSGPTRVRDCGTELPSAARDLLTALAWAAGRGMPAGGVWEAVASALGGCADGAGYDESDVDWVLSAYGRYVVEDSAGSQAVYRLYHREFVSFLREPEGHEGAAAGEVVLGTIVGLLKQQAVVGDWGAVDPYVREWLALHALWAGAPGPGIDVLRELVEWDRGSALPHLAEALHDSAVALSRSGNRGAALELSREAAETYVALASGESAAYLPSLASALNTLAVTLAETGDRQGALEPAHEAVRIRRTLVQTNPAAYLPDLATALNNLAISLAETGDRQGALEPAHEAVRIRRTLVQTNPAAYLPDLAGALNTLANRLAETGDRQGALEPAHEAVRIRRTLVQTNPAAYLPDLATALNNLANHLTATGDDSAALQAYTEAAANLAHDHPAAQRAIEYEREAFLLRCSGRTPEAGLRGLIRLLVDESAEKPDYTSLRIRRALRSFARETQHSRNLLEESWRQETGTPTPAWLSLSDETLDLVEAWMSTRTWADSQEFWSANIDALASEDASTALAEFALVAPVADQHRAILDAIRSEGAAGVYHTLILRDQLTAWMDTETWEDSKRVFHENSELFLDESAEQTLMDADPLTSDAALHAAILYIARNNDIDTAFQCVEDRSALQQHVLNAIREGNAEALWYAAAIELATFNDEPSYATHTQAALLLSDDPDDLDAIEALAPDSLATAAAAADPETRNRLVSELATLSALHGQQHPAHWLSLIQALTQPDAPHA